MEVKCRWRGTPNSIFCQLCCRRAVQRETAAGLPADVGWMGLGIELSLVDPTGLVSRTSRACVMPRGDFAPLVRPDQWEAVKRELDLASLPSFPQALCMHNMRSALVDRGRHRACTLWGSPRRSRERVPSGCMVVILSLAVRLRFSCGPCGAPSARREGCENGNLVYEARPCIPAKQSAPNTYENNLRR